MSFEIYNYLNKFEEDEQLKQKIKDLFSDNPTTNYNIEEEKAYLDVVKKFNENIQILSKIKNPLIKSFLTEIDDRFSYILERVRTDDDLEFGEEYVYFDIFNKWIDDFLLNTSNVNKLIEDIDNEDLDSTDTRQT